MWHGIAIDVLRVAASARVVPVVMPRGGTLTSLVATRRARAAINGGFFNHRDGQAVSHVVVGSRVVADPARNSRLMRNPNLATQLPRILHERAALAHLRVSGRSIWRVVAYRDAVRMRAIDILQAGPMVLPAVRLVDEGFVVRDATGRVIRDGIDSVSCVPRSAVGLTADGQMLWVAAGCRGPGLAIADVSTLMRDLGCIEAMALDGGSSTGLVWRSGQSLGWVSGHRSGLAIVHSALVVEGGGG